MTKVTFVHSSCKHEQDIFSADIIELRMPEDLGDVEGADEARSKSEAVPDVDDVSPYFEYATSALENLKGNIRQL